MPVPLTLDLSLILRASPTSPSPAARLWSRFPCIRLPSWRAFPFIFHGASQSFSLNTEDSHWRVCRSGQTLCSFFLPFLRTALPLVTVHLQVSWISPESVSEAPARSKAPSACEGLEEILFISGVGSNSCAHITPCFFVFGLLPGFWLLVLCTTRESVTGVIQCIWRSVKFIFLRIIPIFRKLILIMTIRIANKI